MSEEYDRLLAEFRELVESVLTRVEPMLIRAASAPSERSGEFSGCGWCPVCALTALVRGENHDLLTFLAEQATVLLAALRAFLDEYLTPRAGGAHAPAGEGDCAAAHGEVVRDESAVHSRPATFEPITVTVKQ